MTGAALVWQHFCFFTTTTTPTSFLKPNANCTPVVAQRCSLLLCALTVRTAHQHCTRQGEPVIRWLRPCKRAHPPQADTSRLAMCAKFAIEMRESHARARSQSSTAATNLPATSSRQPAVGSSHFVHFHLYGVYATFSPNPQRDVVLSSVVYADSLASIYRRYWRGLAKQCGGMAHGAYICSICVNVENTWNSEPIQVFQLPQTRWTLHINLSLHTITHWNDLISLYTLYMLHTARRVQYATHSRMRFECGQKYEICAPIPIAVVFRKRNRALHGISVQYCTVCTDNGFAIM